MSTNLNQFFYYDDPSLIPSLFIIRNPKRLKIKFCFYASIEISLCEHYSIIRLHHPISFELLHFLDWKMSLQLILWGHINLQDLILIPFLTPLFLSVK